MRLMVRRKDGDWRLVGDRPYRDEAHLQQLLQEAPHMIPLEDLGKDLPPPRVIVREAGLPCSGSTDLVGVDEQGGIIIIECKLATNPEVKRKVIGQVLEYVAYLWRMPYEDFDRIFQQKLGEPLATLMQEALDEESRADWSQETFASGVREALENGQFRLVIAVDDLNDQLRQSIEYLNAHSVGYSIHALELDYFADAELEVLVPKLHGAPSVRRPPPPRGQWDAQRFFEDAGKRQLSDQAIRLTQELLELAEAVGDRVFWGTGKDTGSFTLHFSLAGKVVSLYTVWSNGRIQLNYGWMRDRVPNDVLDELVRRMRDIPGFRTFKVAEDRRSWPTTDLARAFPTDSDLQRFKDHVLWLKEQVRRLDQST